jgi:predicted dehydrogenase
VHKKIRVGVVGTSWYADLMHLPAVKSHAQAELSAICGRNRERASEMAAKYDIPQVFTDYQEMIARGGLDALIVSTPDDLHYPVTMAALDKGLHVLCEKPIASSAVEAQEMYEKAIGAGVKNMTYLSWRWFPPFQYLHQLMAEGYLGQCYYAQFRFVGSYGRDGKYGWKWDRTRGLGILGDLGVHMIDMAHWLIGDIATVNAHLASFVQRPGLDGRPLDQSNDSALMIMKFKEGGQGVIQVSAVAHLGNRGMEFQIVLYGQAGTLELSFIQGESYVVRGARSDEADIKPLPIPGHILNGVNPDTPFLKQVEQIFTQQSVGTRSFIESILDDTAASPSFLDGLKAQKVIDAAIEADRRACWVSVA